uniref:PRKC, apoptosis, WT1, regulator n=1 Tax=Poecilia reticulata TaxID=8081 RepID=A0A3P9QGG7_POERE
MATGGFKSNAPADFLEEWKAKREKMRAKMLGDIAKATGVPLNPASSTSTSNSRLGSPPEAHHPAAPAPAATTPTAQGSNLKKAPPQMEKTRCASPDSSSVMACNNDSDKDSPSPSPSKGKEKKNSGPSARKGKGQIEKRKLREKRRSTGVVSIPSNESLDELDDDDAGEKDRRDEEELVQANTFQNESMTADPATGYLLVRASDAEKECLVCSQPARCADCYFCALSRLVKVVQDKDEVIEKLKEEIELLNLDLDEFEDENEQLKQENKTLLKVVGQLTR